MAGSAGMRPKVCWACVVLVPELGVSAVAMDWRVSPRRKSRSSGSLSSGSSSSNRSSCGFLVIEAPFGVSIRETANKIKSLHIESAIVMTLSLGHFSGSRVSVRINTEADFHALQEQEYCVPSEAPSGREGIR